MKYRFSITSLLAAAMVSQVSLAVAQDSNNTEPSVESVTVVTNTRTPQEITLAPWFVHKANYDRQLGELGLRTVPESLRYEPGVLVQRTGPAQSSPYIRGLTGYHNVMVIDGVRLNNSTFRSGPNQYWNTVDPYSLSGYELSQGPGSVAWGSDAAGGALQVFTRNPYGYSEQDGYGGGGRVQLRGASAEESLTGRLELSGTSREGDTQIGVLVGATGRTFGDIRGGSDVGEQPYTAYDEYATDVKIEWLQGAHHRFVFLHQRFAQNDAPRTHKTDQSIDWEGLSIGSDQQRQFDQQRELTYLQYHGTDLEGFAQQISASVSWQRQWESRRRITGGGSVRDESVQVGTFGLWAQATTATALGEFTYGFDWYHDNVNSHNVNATTGGSREVQGPVADDASYDLVGLFVQNHYEFEENIWIDSGLRYTYARAQADRVADLSTADSTDFNSIDEDWHAVTASLRASWDIYDDKSTVLFGGYSGAFRAPNLSDLTRNDTFGTDGQEVPNSDLDAEHFHGLEIGMKGQLQNWGYEATYFYTFLEDQVVRYNTGVVSSGGGTIWEKSNAASGYVNGIELGGHVHLDDVWRVWANTTWMLGETETYDTTGTVLQDTYMTRIMPWTVNLGVRYEIPNTNVWVESVLTYASEADKLSASDKSDTSRIPAGGTPDYLLASISAGWRVDARLDVSLTLDNITNEDYRVHGSGVNGTGFNAILGIDYRF